MKNVDAKIAYIMESFDFDRCRKAMQALDWTYESAYNQIPSIHQLRQTAHSLLQRVSVGSWCASREYVATGGFVARRYKGGLSLSFEVVEQDSEFWNE